MKKTVFLVVMLLLAVSCSIPYYSGVVTYYFPDGTKESYNATKSVDAKDKTISVNYGETGKIMIAHDVPWKFDGTLIQTRGKAKRNQDQPFLFSYNGESYEIPAKVLNEAKKQSQVMGRIDAQRFNDFLVRYVKKAYLSKKQKYEDGIYKW
ncbi:MAG: hypothetical protein IJQ79_07375 [Bacteroidales bacterium]|nr:hypothetical protein [Bacteroidales bacterium]